MKYSYNWLKELSETTKNVDELADMLLTHSFEVEGVEDLSKGLEKVIIGEVLTKQKHPDADKLSVATVNVETQELQIVCGAPNLEAGQKVPVALVGAVLPGGHEIKKAEIRGVESNGMICAEDELGIGTDHAGIIVLDNDAPVGEHYAKYIGLDDYILEIDILPNRGHDALSYIGMANEIRTLEGRGLIAHDHNLKKCDETVSVTIDTKNCNRYIGVKIDHVTLAESPQWLKTRLEVSGMQPINTIVDITNYVMLETGQPLHAFDAKKIDKISVRQAKINEKLILLDDTEIALDEHDVVITQNDHVTALAGVMGGKDSGVSDDTSNIILESASFDATSVRFTQRKYNLQTDAAYRFERKIDPNLALAGVTHAIDLFEKLCGGVVTACTDLYPNKLEPWTILLETAKVTQLLGVDIPKNDMISIVEQLGAAVVDEGPTLHVTVPTVRLDLTTQEDLIEEIGRIYGYEKITKKPLKENVQAPVVNEERKFERLLKNTLVYSGFDEVRSYSFYAPEDVQAIGLDDEKHVALLNPMNPSQAIMRRTLTVGLLQFVKKNASYFDHVQIFDIGRIYDPKENSLPDEKLVLSGAILSKGDNGNQFYDLKGMIEMILDHVGIRHYYFDDTFDSDSENIPHLHPSRRALIKTESGEVIGWIGETDKKARRYFGLKKNRCAICEIDITTLRKEVQSENFFEPLARYPFVSRDVSMIVGAQVRVADVERLIYYAGGDLIKDVDLFDLYEDEQKNQRSMAFHIVFGSHERTLKAQEVDEIMQKIIAHVESELDVEVKK